MSRLPEIGDHVWREENGTVTFDGYVLYVSHGVASIAPKDAELRLSVADAEWFFVRDSGDMAVPLLALVRRLHGWRWAPHDFRPQVAVGDIIEGMLSESPDPKFKHSNVICAGLVRGRLLITAISDYGVNVLWLGGPPVVNEEPAFLDGQNVAKAIAGLDGWRWIPAGWPGEPKGVESRDQKQDAAPAPEPETREVMLETYTDLEVRTGIAAFDVSERIARGMARGTTCRDYPPQDVNGPWEEERCDDCASFHRGECPSPEASDGPPPT